MIWAYKLKTKSWIVVLTLYNHFI